MLPGLHRVTKRLARGRVAEYWYAFRGGPQILAAVATSDAALEAEVERLAPAAFAKFDAERAPKSDRRFLAGLVAGYLAERTKLQEAGQLSLRTLSDDQYDLDYLRTDLGELETRALEAKGARALFIDWRDRWAHQPKTADRRLGAAARVTAWAKAGGKIATDPLTDWPRLYKANRAHLIFEPGDMALLMAGANPAFQNVIQFAALTTLREGDCAAIPKSARREHALVWQTGKSSGRKTIVVPLYPALREFLDGLPANDATTILVSSTGHPWTVAGIGTAMQRAKQNAIPIAAKAGWKAPKDHPDRRSPIDHLHFHDLRGTGATNLVRAGMTLEDLRFLTGWSKERLESIALRYVTAETVALAIVERMRRNST